MAKKVVNENSEEIQRKKALEKQAAAIVRKGELCGASLLGVILPWGKDFVHMSEEPRKVVLEWLTQGTSPNPLPLSAV